MAAKKVIRDKWLTVRLTQAEYNQFLGLVGNSTCQGSSEYVRRIILNKPINVKYRNASVDDFVLKCLALIRELNAIGNNFNQSVHKLHTLDYHPEVRHWAELNERDKDAFFRKMEDIQKEMTELKKLWSQ